MVVVGFKKGVAPLNEELINESYLFLDFEELLKEMENRMNRSQQKQEAKGQAMNT
jgi:hypothetical protein